MPSSNAFTALRALVRKDLVLYFSNRRALVMSIAAPIAIAAFFGYLFGPGGSQTARIPVALADRDASELSRKLDAALRADPALDVRELAEPAALAAVRRGDVRAAIVVPAGFGDAAPRALFGAGAKPEIALHYDPSQAVALAMVRGLLAQHVMDTVSRAVFNGGGAGRWLADLRAPADGAATLAPAARRDLAALFDSIERVQRLRPEAASAPAGAASDVPRGDAFTMPFETRTVAATTTRRPYNSHAHSFAGMGVQFILFMGIEMGVGVLLARRLGLWKRLRAAPLSRALLLGSHIASGAITALVLLAIIYAAAIAFFGVRIDGSLAGFVGVAAAFALLTSSFGLLIAAIGKTPGGDARPGHLRHPADGHARRRLGAGVPLPRLAADRIARRPDALGGRRPRRDHLARPRLRRRARADRRPARLQRALRRDRDLALRLGGAARLTLAFAARAPRPVRSAMARAARDPAIAVALSCDNWS